MRIEELEWDNRNTNHIARHGVSPDEVEEVLFENRPHFRRWRNIFHAYGRTNSGRYLFVVFKMVGRYKARVITAREMTPKERRLYRKVIGL